MELKFAGKNMVSNSIPGDDNIVPVPSRPMKNARDEIRPRDVKMKKRQNGPGCY